MHDVDKYRLQLAVDISFTIIKDKLNILLIQRRSHLFQGMYAITQAAWWNVDESVREAVFKSFYGRSGK